jgi:hypothetical protein
MILTTTSENVDLYNYRKAGTTTYSSLYTQSVTTTALTSTGGLSPNLQWGVPFIVTRNCVIDRFGLEITAGGTAGSLSRLGIYLDNGNLSPGTLLLDAGTIANDSATLQLITVNQALPAGMYWLSFVMNSAASPTFRTISAGTYAPVLGVPTTAGAAHRGIIAPAFTFAALPSTFTTFSGTDIYVSPQLAFFMRFSA